MPEKPRKRQPEMCSVEGCNKASRKRGMCETHYSRWKKNGVPGPAGTLTERHGKHGTKVYEAWRHMIERCHKPGSCNYPKYGARGITVCPAWRRSFSAFYRDMGEPPSPKHQLDRIDGDGNYEPGNCRWATQTENLRNRRFVKLDMGKARQIRTLNAGGMSAKDLAKRFGVDPEVVRNVLRGRRWAESKEGVPA